jgi:hypothetical protein
MSRKLNPEIQNFEEFQKRLLAFVAQGKPCYSIRDKMEYTSHMEGSTIIMSGKNRQKPSEYSKEDLKAVYQIIKNETNITTTMLAPAVGRHRSPILGLMVTSGVVVEG